MKDSVPGAREALIRESLLFQLKLLADGLRDFVLLPLSLMATLIGLARSGQDPEAEFNRVLDLGRKTERWIDLFGNHAHHHERQEMRSLDGVVNRVESVIRQQVNEGNISEAASTHLANALDSLQRKVVDNTDDAPASTDNKPST